MSQPPDVDVLVCGAGVGGLATARALGGLGLRVLVLDKQREPRPVAKGELLQPAILDILRGWGAQDALVSAGAVRLGSVVIRDAAGAGLLSLPYRRLPAGKQWLLAHDYLTICGAIAAGLGDTVEVRRGTVVRDAVSDGGRVTGLDVESDGTSYRVRAPLVVAADGIASRLRRFAGAGGRRVEYPHRLVSFEIPDSATAEELAAHVTGRGLRLVYPLPGGRTRLYVQTGPDELRGMDAAALRAWCARVIAETPALAGLAEPLLANLDRRQLLSVWRFLAPKLAGPGMALVGEAAHAVHPMAAQGMNSAIADAAELGDLLTGVDLAEEAVLDRVLRTYQERRMPVLTHIDTVSHNAARMITETSPLRRLIGRRMMRCTARTTGSAPPPPTTCPASADGRCS
jgi:2-polyprenyl-6-methoxyphenol hydroxylase-like FAD-dependent oxidoreductase